MHTSPPSDPYLYMMSSFRPPFVVKAIVSSGIYFLYLCQPLKLKLKFSLFEIISSPYSTHTLIASHHNRNTRHRRQEV